MDSAIAPISPALPLITVGCQCDKSSNDRQSQDLESVRVIGSVRTLRCSPSERCGSYRYWIKNEWFFVHIRLSAYATFSLNPL